MGTGAYPSDVDAASLMVADRELSKNEFFFIDGGFRKSGADHGERFASSNRNPASELFGRPRPGNTFKRLPRPQAGRLQFATRSKLARIYARMGYPECGGEQADRGPRRHRRGLICRIDCGMTSSCESLRSG